MDEASTNSLPRVRLVRFLRTFGRIQDDPTRPLGTDGSMADLHYREGMGVGWSSAPSLTVGSAERIIAAQGKAKADRQREGPRRRSQGTGRKMENELTVAGEDAFGHVVDCQVDYWPASKDGGFVAGEEQSQGVGAWNGEIHLPRNLNPTSVFPLFRLGVSRSFVPELHDEMTNVLLFDRVLRSAACTPFSP